MRRRDDFTRATIRVVAARVGFICSNPSCRRSTSGPHSEPDKFLSIGAAAHISAASSGGPRYDPNLSSEERRSPENAIWLCHTCARLVDYDAEKYSVESLRKWKAEAERIATAAINTFQSTNWPRDIKKQCERLLAACDDASDSFAKGKALEDLIEVLFTSEEGLVCWHKRAKTGDEEIDLVLTNNVNRPFWMALRSPLLFVECKNWSSKVGTKEVRDFEIKIQNHSLAQVGFFVSLNGFSAEVGSELKRMGRSDYHLVPIERADLASYLAADIGLLDWLEKLMSRLR